MSVLASITLLISACILIPASDVSFVNADTSPDGFSTARNPRASPTGTGHKSEVHAVHIALADSSAQIVASTAIEINMYVEDPFGWNLPSTPAGGLKHSFSDQLNVVDSTSGAAGHLTIEDQLSSIAGKYTAVWGYDASQQRWKAYFPSEPVLANDLIRLEVGQGYWIKASQDCTLTYGGGQYMLNKGWNTIGWLGGEPMKIVDSTSGAAGHLPIEDQLRSIAGKYTAVWSFDGSQQRWKAYFPSEPIFVNDLIEIEAGKAYWIKTTRNCTLAYGGRQYMLNKGWNTFVWLVGAPGGAPTPQTGGDFAKQGGCFIATAAYGTSLVQEIDVLRQFRDAYLLSNPAGRLFISLYYGSSPLFARLIEDNPAAKPLVRVGLLPALYLSKFAIGTTLAEKIAVFGGLALVLLVLVVWFRRQTSVMIRS